MALSSVYVRLSLWSIYLQHKWNILREFDSFFRQSMNALLIIYQANKLMLLPFLNVGLAGP